MNLRPRGVPSGHYVRKNAWKCAAVHGLVTVRALRFSELVIFEFFIIIISNRFAPAAEYLSPLQSEIFFGLIISSDGLPVIAFRSAATVL